MLLTNLIGPISLEDWVFLIELRKSLRFYKSRDPERFSWVIKKETELYDKTLKRYKKVA